MIPDKGIRKIEAILEKSGWRKATDMFNEYIYRQYAEIINHGKPRKVAWHRLTEEQRSRAFEVARSYGGRG